MPLDTNIALGVKPVEQPNMLAQMGQMMQLRQAQQEYEGENALRGALQNGLPEDPSTLLKYGSKGRAVYEAVLKGNKDKLDSAEKYLGLYKDQVGFIKTPEDAARWLGSFYDNPLTRPFVEATAPKDKAISAIPTSDPIAFQKWLQNASQKSEKLFVDANTAATNAQSNINNQRTVGVQRDRLNAESTPLALDEKTIDLVANRYLIDGTLPPLGMGKPAAILRAKILDRAQAIATAPPAATPPPPNAAPPVTVNPQTSAAPVVNNLNPTATTTLPTVNNLITSPTSVAAGSTIMNPNAPNITLNSVPSAVAPVTTPAPVGTTPQQAAQNIVTSKTNTATQRKALTDFSTGVQGRMVNSMNTAINHLSSLDELAKALQNNDVRAINTVGNLVAKQTGNPAPTNFAAARQIVAQEIVKAIVANGGTGKERDEAAANIAAAGSPEQLAGVISTYKELLAGQLESLGLQYKNTTGRDDFHTKLLPITIQTLSRSGAKSPAKTGDITSDANVAKVVSPNVVTTPDGKSHTFPNAEAAAAFKKAIGQ